MSNKLDNKDLEKVIGASTNDHIVRPGETLAYIAQLHNCKMSDLIKLNNISNPDLIHVGQVIKYPC